MFIVIVCLIKHHIGMWFASLDSFEPEICFVENGQNILESDDERLQPQ